MEQRLNALNPRAAQHNQRIYSFTLVDRESLLLSLDSTHGMNISNNLAFRDLFSFDVIRGRASRYNLEAMFQQYEAVMEANTVDLLRKLGQGSDDLKKEILEIFVAKFMNFLRNPYSVRKVLNTIGGVLRFHPAEPELLADYNAVLTGQKPHQSYLCARLGLSSEEYQAWLSALFMTLIRPAPGELNIMEGIVKQVFESPAGYPMVCVYRYEGEHADKRCLLSDRGYSTPLSQDQYLSFNFNLCSTAFITYVFTSIDAPTLATVPPAVMELYRTQPRNVRVVPFTNNLAALERYNQNVVYQCNHSVYSSSPSVYGLG
ncbi:MAG: hypothetical protein WA672_01600 [Candidatus Angelobacter sp.]